MFKKIISCIALVFLCSCSFGQNKNIAATRAYCDHNRTVAATEAVSQLKPILEDYIVDEVDRVSRSFVTNAYPVPIPITNTIYQITDNVISNRTIYETTNVLVYSQYSFTTNEYYSVNNITNIINDYTTTTNIFNYFYETNTYEVVTNIVNNITTNIYNDITTTTNIINDYTTTTNIFNYFAETNYVNVTTSNIIDITVTNLDLLAIYYPDNDVTNISQFLDSSYYDIEILNNSTASIRITAYNQLTNIVSMVIPYFVIKDNNRYIVSQFTFDINVLSSIESIIAPTTVKSISGTQALYYIPNLSYLSLPGVTNFDFRIKTNLEEIYLPSVVRLGEDAFNENFNLKSVTLPNIVELENSAFYNCTNLSNINIPNINKIGDFAFFRCNPSYISLPFVTEIGDGAFYQCKSLKDISLPSVRKLGDSVFLNCESLENITLLQDGVVNIKTNSFLDCTSLRRLKIPSAVSLNTRSFSGCVNLEYIYIPNVTNIDIFAFQGCDNLKYIDFGPNPLLNVPVLNTNLGLSGSLFKVLVPKDMKSSFIEQQAWDIIASHIIEY